MVTNFVLMRYLIVNTNFLPKPENNFLLWDLFLDY